MRVSVEKNVVVITMSCAQAKVIRDTIYGDHTNRDMYDLFAEKLSLVLSENQRGKVSEHQDAS